MRAMIVDDETLARDRLRGMLRSEASIEIVGECASGPEAVDMIREARPDVVFLDLQMPGCDGIAVATQFAPEQRPAIVFVTAHDRYAVDAFKVGAIDYLLKPFDRERLQVALRRVAEDLRSRRAGPLAARLEKLLSTTAGPERVSPRFAVKQKGRVVFVSPDEIRRVEAADNYVVLHLQNGERLMFRESLSAMEERLGTERFVRVNRSTLVHLNQIRELKGTAYGDYIVVLRDGTGVPLSRNLRGRFDHFLSNEPAARDSPSMSEHEKRD